MSLANSEYCASDLPKSTKFSESCDTLIIKLSAIASIIIVIYWPLACSVALIILGNLIIKLFLFIFVFIWFDITNSAVFCLVTQITYSVVDALNLLEANASVLAAYVSQGYPATILGDLNFPDINWSADPAVATNIYSSAMVGLFIAWDMIQIASVPTRGNSFLDIIITITPSVFNDCCLLPPIDKSDHANVVSSLSFLLHTSQNGNKRRKRINYDTLQQRLSAINWQIFLAASVDFNDIWNIFQETLNKTIDDCAI